MRVELATALSASGVALTAAWFSAQLSDSVLAHEETPSDYSYYEHVRPILATHCGGCHRPGGVGPMSLLEYEDAIPWANAMKLQLLEGTMPPWLPDDASSSLRHGRSLTPEELNIVVDWAVGQTPEGDRDPANEPEIAEPTSLAAMDLILELDEPIVLGEDDYERDACVVFTTGLSERRALAAVSLMPGEGRTILRHAVAVLGDTCDATSRAVFSWLPDRSEASLVRTAEPLGPGASFAVSLIYRKGWREDGVAISDTPRLGLDFAEPVVSVTSHLAEDTRFAVSEPMRLAAVFPALAENANGRDFELVVEYPDGARELIIAIESYQPEWREKYILASPKHLPPGSTIELTRPGVWLDFLPAERPTGE